MFGTHPTSVYCGDIVHLNVGGTRFSTSRQTLTWIPDSFFTALLNGRISSSRDENGAIFIDRDPNLFSKILNYLRTKDIDIQNVNMISLKHEAEFYGITPLLKRLLLCEDVSHSTCGNILFSGYLTPGDLPFQGENKSYSQVIPETHGSSGSTHVRAISCGVNKLVVNTKPSEPNSSNKEVVSNMSSSNSCGIQSKSSLDVRSSPRNVTGVHVRTSSVDLRHSRNSSFDLNKALFNDGRSLYSQLNGGGGCDPMQVKIIKGNFNVIAVAYSHFVTCFKMKSTGWEQGFKSPYIEQTIEGLALNAESGPSNRPATDILLVGICYSSYVKLWGIASDGNCFEYGTFMLDAVVDSLFFIGNRLVALSRSGKIGVWHGGTRHWQIQDIVPITSYDTAGSFLLLGCNNGSIYYIDMQKFPLRMKDNELLVTELYKDPSNDVVTAISVYLTPKSSCKTSPGICGIWIEIAYGTSSGAVHVIVQHPETVGHGPQLFQTFIVHRSPVTKVCLSEKFLISVCSEYNHVRTWSVTRFRGMISTQPGSMPVASYKILSLEDVRVSWNNNIGNSIGPFGEQDDEQVFIQKVVPRSDQIYIRLASTGKRAGVIKSVDCTGITAFCVHECDGINKMGPLPRRFLFTGHVNGSIQMWDLTTALELYNKGEMADTVASGGPSVEELFKLLDQCDLSNADSVTPSASPSPSALNPSAKVKASNMAFLNQISNCGKVEGADKVINL